MCHHVDGAVEGGAVVAHYASGRARGEVEDDDKGTGSPDRFKVAGRFAPLMMLSK